MPLSTSSIPTHMKAIAIENAGKETGELVMVDVPVPTLNENQILIRVHASGVNRADILQRQGLYPPPENASPLPGLEAAGEVVAVGANVSRWKIGDKVCALLNGGGYAQYAVAHEGHAFPVPDGWNMNEAAALPEALFTIWMALVDAVDIKAGESLLVHGGASGIGMTAIQYARAHGITVYATAGNDEKCNACLAWGATRAINYRSEDFVSVIADATNKKGVDVILDMVGGDYITRNFKSLAIDGRMVSIAFLSGTKMNDGSFGPLLSKRLTWKGVALRAQSDKRKNTWRDAIESHVWAYVCDGLIRPKIHASFTMHDIKKSHVMIEKNLNIGKIVIQQW